MNSHIDISHPDGYWPKVRRFYLHHEKAICKRPDAWGIDPYAWDEAGITLTSAQALLWQDIRSANAVLYPQYPVGPYFIDFANPAAKVGVVIFTAAAAEATLRAQFEDMGWKMYFIEDVLCRQDTQEDEDEHGHIKVTKSAPAEFIRFICQRERIAEGAHN